MSARASYTLQRWWWRRFHPLTRVGWITATSGRTRTATQTIVGVGLVGAGLMLRHRGKRTVLYRGSVAPGEVTRIKVYRGDREVSDRFLRRTDSG